MQQIQQLQRLIYRLEKIFIVFDHLAAYKDTKPLFIHVEFITIENPGEWLTESFN